MRHNVNTAIKAPLAFSLFMPSALNGITVSVKYYCLDYTIKLTSYCLISMRADVKSDHWNTSCFLSFDLDALLKRCQTQVVVWTFSTRTAETGIWSSKHPGSSATHLLAQAAKSNTAEAAARSEMEPSGLFPRPQRSQIKYCTWWKRDSSSRGIFGGWGGGGFKEAAGFEGVKMNGRVWSTLCQCSSGRCLLPRGRKMTGRVVNTENQSESEAWVRHGHIQGSSVAQ